MDTFFKVLAYIAISAVILAVLFGDIETDSTGD